MTLAFRNFRGQCQTAARIQLVLQIDQGNLDGMRELASTDAVYIACAKSAAGIGDGKPGPKAGCPGLGSLSCCEKEF